MDNKVFCAVLICFSSFFFISSKAQKTIPLFFEKAYLHTDRSFYAGGDNIWFKAYVVNARTNIASISSSNLYVELFGPDGKLVQREIIQVVAGVGNGDFMLPENVIGGTYHLRAYTNWMKNFGNHFFFEKDIQVASIEAQDVLAEPNVERQYKASGTISTASNSIQFFPEGGSFVANLSCLVSFKVLNPFGKSTDATGVVFSEKGDTVAHFSTSYLGMGSFKMTPLQDVDYKAMITYKGGKREEVDLPSVYSSGYTLASTQDDSSIVIHISANQFTLSANSSSEVIIAGRNTGKILYKEKIQLKEGEAEVKVRKGVFPTGIAAFTVYDEKLRPNAERLVYVENKNKVVHLSVSSDKATYGSKEKVTLNIKATDANNLPIVADLSLSAFDGELMQSSQSNIASYLILESEISGDIENAASYFDENNSNRFQQLDLLLLTQGWRNFLWRQLADTTHTIKYLPEPGITLSGSVKALFGKQNLPDMNITLLASGAKGSKLYFTKTDSSGKYFLDGLPLFGKQPIKISSKNNKGKKGGIILLDTLKEPLPYFVSIDPMKDNKEILRFQKEAKKRWDIQKENGSDYLTMSNVVVTANAKPNISRDGSVEIKSGYSFSATVNPDDKQFGTVENYLIHKTSAVADAESEGVTYPLGGKYVRPRFVVDNREDVFDRIDYYAIPIDQVLSVSLNQVVASNPGGLSNRIVIQLVLKPGAYNQDMALLITDVDGYYESRTFYSPTYHTDKERNRKDARTTIFWEPQVTTNAEGKATVSYYNADPKTRIKVSVQGITNKGTPVSAGTEYWVK